VKQGTGLLPATFIPTSNARNELMLKEVREWRRKKEKEVSIADSVSLRKPQKKLNLFLFFLTKTPKQINQGLGLRRAPQGAREGNREHQGGD
jgi:hypothetical protein